jgi:LuxR family maltose regulon positive regulatory protein
MVQRELNNLEEAARHLADGIDLCRQVGYMFDQVVGYSTLARVLQAKQDWDGARRALQSAEGLSQKMRGYVFAQRWVEDCRVRLWSAQDRVSDIARWIQETDLRVDDQIRFGRELEHIILARALVTLGRGKDGKPYLDGALDLLGRLLDMAESAGWTGKAIEILVLQAMALYYRAAHRGRDDHHEALAALERALSLAETEGYVRTFVDEGPPMARLLRMVGGQRTKVSREYLDDLLAAFEAKTVAVESPVVQGPSSALVEPLSERELEVLGLIAQGRTNREIAARLYLALSTVKVHTRNIYGKLGVHSRTQAVAKAQSLDLL